MARIIVTGASGLLGSTLTPLLEARQHVVLRHGRSPRAEIRADLADLAQTLAALDEARPSVIVNLAAATDVDECERKPQFAYLSNVRIVENLARWIRQSGTSCHLIQISTDQVYDGPGPHREDRVTLTNFYAFSKYAGELAAATVPSTILRTTFFGRSRCPERDSFSDWITKALLRRERIRVFKDVTFSPLSLDRLADLIELAITKQLAGIFNLGCRDGASKADFAFALAKALGLPGDAMTPALSSEMSLRAYRPKDMRMDCSRFEQTFGVRLPTLEEEINSLRRQCHDET